MPAPYPQTDGSEPCVKGNPERFHPDIGKNGKALDAVKAECRPCHIKDACLKYALTRKVSGIWAGTSPEERDAIRKRDGIKAEPLTFGGLKERVIAAPPGHGDWKGINHHRSRYERPCDACRAFASEQSRRGRERRKQAAAG